MNKFILALIVLSLLLGFFVSCDTERKPLEVYQLTGKDYRENTVTGVWEYIDIPMKEIYCLKNYRDDKQGWKDILSVIFDTTTVLHIGPDNFISVWKDKAKGSFEEGSGHVDGDNIFWLVYADIAANGYLDLFVASKEHKVYDSFYKECKYDYELTIEGESTIISLDYEKFNSEEFQKFLNVVSYNKRIKKSTSKKYLMRNSRIGEIECIVEYPFADKRSFSIEII